MLTALRQLAAPYADLLGGAASSCTEPPLHPPSELHLQAFWMTRAAACTVLSLSDGTPVTLHDPGRWNRAPGPDFCDAILSIGGRRLRGNVELHLHPADWDAHRHAENPDYRDLILHVTWYPGSRPKTLPAEVPSLALQPCIDAESPFDFSTLPLKGAPYLPEATAHPCLIRLASDAERRNTLVRAAGCHRLFLKAKTFASALTPDAGFQTFYEALLRSAGYRRNTDAFLRLAEEYPFVRLQPLPSRQRFAVLAGAAGLLTERRRDLWDLWWSSGLPPPLTPYTWDLRALRPQNHPLRRLAGTVGLLHHISALLETPIRELPAAISEAGELLKETLPVKGTLIGGERAATLLINLFVPYRLAVGTLPLEDLLTLPGESLSAPIKETWHRLTGSLSGIPEDGLRRQGLIQIYTDLCHNPAVSCETCPLALRC